MRRLRLLCAAAAPLPFPRRGFGPPDGAKPRGAVKTAGQIAGQAMDHAVGQVTGGRMIGRLIGPMGDQAFSGQTGSGQPSAGQTGSARGRRDGERRRLAACARGRPPGRRSNPRRGRSNRLRVGRRRRALSTGFVESRPDTGPWERLHLFYAGRGRAIRRDDTGPFDQYSDGRCFLIWIAFCVGRGFEPDLRFGTGLYIYIYI